MLTAFYIFWNILRYSWMSLATRRSKLQGKALLMETSPDPLLSSFRSLNEQRPTVPKEGSTSFEYLLWKRNEFVCKLITFIFYKIFLDILGCRLQRSGLKRKEKRS